MKKHSISDLPAIEIGISRRNWEFMRESNSKEECLSFMEKKRYDVLPLKNAEGLFEKFWITRDWNDFSDILLMGKKELPMMRHDEKLDTILQSFIQRKQRFFLLRKGAAVIGLISIANFGYREIYRRLCNMLSELELELADWVFRKIGQDKVFNILMSKSESGNSRAVLGQYLLDRHCGIEGSLKEYLFLSSLHNVVYDQHLYVELGFVRKTWKSLANPLFETRNSVAHPIRRIIKDESDFERVLFSIRAARKILAKI
jgi:hypothetical protein